MKKVKNKIKKSDEEFKKNSYMLIVVLVLIVSAFAILNYIKYGGAENNNYSEIIKTSISNIDEIILDVKNDKVDIFASDTEVVTIRYYETIDDPLYKYEEYDDTVKLTKIRKPFINIFSFNFNVMSGIVIEVPRNSIIKYNIKTSNGRIDLNNVNIDISKFRTSNGSVNFTNVSSEETIDIETSNGKVILDNINSNDIEVVTTNGIIELNNINTKTLFAKSSNGKVEIENVNTSEKLLVETSNGRVTFDGLSSPYIDIKTSNSRVEGTVRGSVNDYNKNFRTSNGDITINGTEYSKKYVDEEVNHNFIIKSSNGDIRVDFESRF